MNTTEEPQAPSAPAPAPAPSAPAPAPAPSNEPAAPTIDYNRLIDDDEYAARVEQDHGGTSEAPAAPGEAIEPAPTGDQPAPAPTAGTPAPAPASDDPDPVVETIVVEGQERQVRRSQQRDLLQKGAYMERRFERAAPLLQLEREAPDLLTILRDPQARRKVIELLRTNKSGPAKKPEQPATDDVPEGVNPDDVAWVHRKAEATTRALLARAGIQVPDEQDQEADQQERTAAAARVDAHIEALENTDPEFAATTAAIPQLLAKMEKELPREKFLAFKAVINDPRSFNKVSGKPAFVHFYHDVRRAVIAQRSKAPAPAGAGAAGTEGEPAGAPVAPAAPAPRPRITPTLEPGASAARPSGAPRRTGPDYNAMSPAQKLAHFNRLIDGG